jgi:hypothetical protein
MPMGTKSLSYSLRKVDSILTLRQVRNGRNAPSQSGKYLSSAVIFYVAIRAERVGSVPKGQYYS